MAGRSLLTVDTPTNTNRLTHAHTIFPPSLRSCTYDRSPPPSTRTSSSHRRRSQGASGAGKSTFLDLLAGKKKDGECAGQILLTRDLTTRGRGGGGGGRGRRGWARRRRKKGARAAVYVTQDDFHVAELTVRESLAFAVRLGMGGEGVR